MAQYRACERCGRAIDDTVKHRGAWNTAGSVGGSLGGSYAASAAMAPLGIAGSLVGAVGGAIVGSKAGSEASKASCNAVDKVQAGKLCEACTTAETTRSAGYKNWGGGRLGGPDQGETYSSAPAAPPQPSVGQRLSGAASNAGQSLGGAASTAGGHISGAASWVKQKTVGGAPSADAAPSGNSTFVPFSGGGQTLGSAPAAAPTAQRPWQQQPMASAPIAHLPLQPQQPMVSAPMAPATAGLSQMEQDEAMARRLQEEFLMMDAQGR